MSHPLEILLGYSIGRLGEIPGCKFLVALLPRANILLEYSIAEFLDPQIANHAVSLEERRQQSFLETRLTGSCEFKLVLKQPPWRSLFSDSPNHAGLMTTFSENAFQMDDPRSHNFLHQSDW